MLSFQILQMVSNTFIIDENYIIIIIGQFSSCVEPAEGVGRDQGTYFLERPNIPPLLRYNLVFSNSFRALHFFLFQAFK